MGANSERSRGRQHRHSMTASRVCSRLHSRDMTLDTNTMNWQGKWNAPSASLVLQVQHQTLPDKNYKFSFRVYNPPENQTMTRTRLTLSGVIIVLTPSFPARGARVSCMKGQLHSFRRQQKTISSIDMYNLYISILLLSIVQHACCQVL
jgi:hypothetical protein